MWHAIGRIIVIPIAFILSALIVIAVLLTLGLEHITQSLGGPVHTIEDPDQLFKLWDMGAIGLTIVSGATIIPALLAILVGEIARIRSWIYYVLTGGISVVAIPLLAGIAQSTSPEVTTTAPSLFANTWPIFATAGFAGGGLYWLLAGRKA
ncbi:MAG: hypothetical protein ACRBCJ_12265 [Hyphomicrobiaceae bacterium]